MAQSALKLVGKEEGDKQRALEAALSQIDRAFGKGSVMKLGDKGKIVEIDNFNRISLENGQVFKLAFGLRPSNYRKDDIVDVTWFTYAKGYRDAFAIKLIQRR